MSKYRSVFCAFFWTSAVAGLTLGLSPGSVRAEEEEVPKAEVQILERIKAAIPGVIEDKPADDKKPKAKDEPTVDVPRTAAVTYGPRYLKLHLFDGSVITGDLSIAEINVDTPFGKLVVPVERIRSFSPGLDSFPELSAKIVDTIKKLGSDDYKTREQAHKDLAAMGVKVQKELEKFVSDENAEIKRHVGEILKEFEEAAEEQGDDEESPVEQAWIRQDTVVTSDFTVVGKVSPAEFKINSKYGELNVKLADVRRAEREAGAKESFRKSVTVQGENLAQRSFKSTGIRVQAGDRITIKAEGSIVMSPWGSNASSGPDGAPNYGWYIPNQIAGGALVARIGEKGTIYKVGKQHSVVAKTSGVLQLAIGMQGDYAGDGYQFPGEYRVKLKIDPK
ncbi:PA-IL-like protein [Anatilimnocola aggregata]|uniref:PA-IL-like protein n=1 Tax=Anatilimnocola aggregata TaxID=2528021 RepID=A0A517Y7T8_9BACT|nr:LecA/PA-IL family lectin [Anatilimnocola aggregata]QDU26314.1 PA-IL-like protein [Anatilimnocola aggregata]